MAIQVRFTPEQEAQRARLASRASTDPEHLVKDAALRLLEDEARVADTIPELPVWHLAGPAPFIAATSTMTSVEPGVSDANVLVYAMDADHPHHAASRALLDMARTRSTTLYVTSQILCEFYSIVTNLRRVPKPRTQADAIAAISGMLAFLRVLPSPVRTTTVLMEFLQAHPVTGAEIFDLQIAAAMKVNNILRIYTFNVAGFEVFPELTVTLPVT